MGNRDASLYCLLVGVLLLYPFSETHSFELMKCEGVPCVGGPALPSGKYSYKVDSASFKAHIDAFASMDESDVQWWIKSASSTWMRYVNTSFLFDYGGPVTGSVCGEKNDNKSRIVAKDSLIDGDFVIARTYRYFSETTGLTGEADICVTSFNGFPLSFFVDPEDAGSTNYDIIGILAHELGHVLGLDHSSGVANIMSPDFDPTRAMRLPSSDDLQGLSALYTPLYQDIAWVKKNSADNHFNWSSYTNQKVTDGQLTYNTILPLKGAIGQYEPGGPFDYKVDVARSDVRYTGTQTVSGYSNVPIYNTKDISVFHADMSLSSSSVWGQTDLLDIKSWREAAIAANTHYNEDGDWVLLWQDTNRIIRSVFSSSAFVDGYSSNSFAIATSEYPPTVTYDPDSDYFVMVLTSTGTNLVGGRSPQFDLRFFTSPDGVNWTYQVTLERKPLTSPDVACSNSGVCFVMYSTYNVSGDRAKSGYSKFDVLSNGYIVFNGTYSNSNVVHMSPQIAFSIYNSKFYHSRQYGSTSDQQSNGRGIFKIRDGSNPPSWSGWTSAAAFPGDDLEGSHDLVADPESWSHVYAFFSEN